MNIDDIKQTAAYNLQSMINSLPLSLKNQENDFFRKIEASRFSSLKKLEMLYGFMDVLYNYVHKFTPCKKGCSFCCSYDVTISEVEIQFIEKNNKKVKRNSNIAKNNNIACSPCIFLKDYACLIYKTRPYVCRRHVMFTSDNKLCTKEYSFRYEISLLNWTELDKSYEYIRAISGSIELHDIRDVFREKLKNTKG